MGISFNAYVPIETNNVSSKAKITNYSQVSRNQYLQNSIETPCFSKNVFEDNLLIGNESIEGSINGRIVSIQRKCTLKSLFFRMYTYKGIIGNEKVDLQHSFSSGKGSVISGKIGDKQVNISLSGNIWKQYSISGNIDEKNIDISKDSPVSSAKGENTALTLLASLMGVKLNTQDGYFTSLTESKIKEDEKYGMYMLRTNNKESNQYKEQDHHISFIQ